MKKNENKNDKKDGNVKEKRKCWKKMNRIK